MDPATVERLLAINSQFYQTFAVQFSQTRQRIQPGVHNLLKRVPQKGAILDLGCGNGELWVTLQQRGFAGRYIGLDSSVELLEIARQRADQENPTNRPVFLQADLARDWDQDIEELFHKGSADSNAPTFDFILAFAVLHHLPGKTLRHQTLGKIKRLLAASGKFFHSEWQFLNSSKLAARVQAWGTVGVDESLVDTGDYLLDWRGGGSGLRYVHHFDLQELEKLATETGFGIEASFHSDGKGGNLGLYQVWSAVKLGHHAHFDHL